MCLDIMYRKQKLWKGFKILLIVMKNRYSRHQTYDIFNHCPVEHMSSLSHNPNVLLSWLQIWRLMVRGNIFVKRMNQFILSTFCTIKIPFIPSKQVGRKKLDLASKWKYFIIYICDLYFFHQLYQLHVKL